MNKVERLTPAEKKEFAQLKRDLLEYHHFGLTTYNPKKERYNELLDKNARAFVDGMKFFDRLHNQIENN